LFIYIWSLHLADEITFNSKTFSSLGRNRLQAILGGLPGDVAEELLDGCDQGLFFL
jgi:hypothetical protein